MIIKLLIVFTVVFILLILWAFCRTSAKADREIEKMYKTMKQIEEEKK